MWNQHLTAQENGRVCMFGEIKIILHRINIDETSRSRFDNLDLRYVIVSMFIHMDLENTYQPGQIGLSITRGHYYAFVNMHLWFI